jgi:hypothetical protein
MARDEAFLKTKEKEKESQELEEIRGIENHVPMSGTPARDLGLIQQGYPNDQCTLREGLRPLEGRLSMSRRRLIFNCRRAAPRMNCPSGCAQELRTGTRCEQKRRNQTNGRVPL